MDPRVRQHAEIIADHSTAVGPGDAVIIRASTPAEDLVVALCDVLGARNAQPAISWSNGRAHRAHLQAMDTEDFEPPAHVLAFVEAADVYIDIKATENTHEKSDISAESTTAYSRSLQPVGEALLNTRGVLTQFPTAADAQQAGMSTAAYETFVWDAINRDWSAQAERQAKLVEILDAGESVRIRTDAGTDLSMQIADNPVVSDTAEDNLPGGEVYTAPLPESVEGEVVFDLPGRIAGQEVLDARITFEEGNVVEYEAGEGEERLEGLFATDEGARRVGELGIGMNDGIDRFTRNTLFDEKMAGTVHLAFGRAYEETVASGNDRNDSSVHQDMLVDVSDGASIEVDGTVIQRDAAFIFEDGF